MTGKILLYIDGWFFHYAIAKILQEKYDYELYSIIDVEDKAKQFFINQKLVNFKKTWYYLDNISKPDKKPDENYLKTFEEKYKINLWKIAYSDKDFYKYNIHYKFDDDEILCILEQECKFFENVLDEINPDFLFTYVPITHYQNLLFQMCRSKNIKVLMLGPIRFGNRMMISEEPIKIDYMKYLLSNNQTKLQSVDNIEQFLENYDLSKSIKEKHKINFESHKMDRYKGILKFFVTPRTKSYEKRFSNYGKTRYSVFVTKLSRSLKRKYRESFINHNLSQDIDGHTSFVYLPLHVEKERLFLVDFPFYENQLVILTNVARSLPLGYKLYVKEHPMMKTQAWRPISFYQEIMNLPNVKLIHPSVNSLEIIKKSSLVITIAGSTGQEAAFHNIPVITFTDQVYSIISSVHKIKNMEELPDTIRDCLTKKVEPTGIAKFIDIIDQNTFEFDHRGLASEFAYRFGFKGPLMDAELPIKDVESFLEKNNQIFEQLTYEHIKKINQHKEHQSKKLVENN